MTGSAIPSWSASAWVSTSRSSRPTPASSSRRRIGPCGGPVSTSTAAPSRCSSVASPWPTSMNETTSSPRAGGAGRPARACRAATATASAAAPATARIRRRPCGRGPGTSHPRALASRARPATATAERGVRERQCERAAEPHRQRGERRAGGGVRDPFEVAEQRRAGDGERQRRGGRDLRGGHAQHAQPHDRRDDGRREQVGGQRGERHLLEVEREERGGRHGGRDRDRGRVGDRIGKAPAREQRPQRRREQQQPGDGRERELPAGLAGRARVQHERDRRGEAERVPARRRPARERGDQPGDPHHPRALDRRAAAGERHVQRDEDRRGDQPRPQRHVEHRAGREHQHAEQQHVLAGDGEQVREARPPEVGLDVLGDRLVLPEHHPAQQRGLGRREPAAQAVGRPLADGVEPAREAAARASGRRPARDVDRRVCAAPPLVGVDVAERRHRPPQPQLAADAHAGRPAPVRRTGDRDLAVEPARDRRGAAGVAPQAHVAREAHAGDRAAVAARLERLEEDRARVDRAARERGRPPGPSAASRTSATAAPVSTASAARTAATRRPPTGAVAAAGPAAAAAVGVVALVAGAAAAIAAAAITAAASTAGADSGPSSRPATKPNRTACRGWRRTASAYAPRRPAVRASPPRAASPGASRRSPGSRRAPRSSRSRRAPRARRGSSAR